MMISSQPSAQPVASLHSGTETGIKRIVPHRGSASGSDPPRSSPEAEPCLLKKTPTERKYTSYPQAARRDPGYWPVISLLASTQDHAKADQRTLADISGPIRPFKRCSRQLRLTKWDLVAIPEPKLG